MDRRVEKKRYILQYYQKHLGDLPGISFMPMPEGTDCNCWLSVIQLAEDCPVKPKDIMRALEEDDVESRPVWKPMHLQPIFSGCDFVSQVKDIYISEEESGADSSVSGQLFAHGVCMPSDSKMTDEDLQRICKAVRKLWQ